MEITAVILFAVAAVVGAYMAVQRLQGHPLPRTAVALAHGGVAAVALVVYIVAVAAADPTPTLGLWAIGLFVAAALGGATMFLGFHLRGRELPLVFVLGHGSLAVVAFVVLLAAVLAGG